MPIQHRRSNTAGVVPSDLLTGELALNTKDGFVFMEKDGVVKRVGRPDPADLSTPETLANKGLTTMSKATVSQVSSTTTSGAITLDWSATNWIVQSEPTGTITYTFTAPAGPCHLQLLIQSDGTSSAQTIGWPGTVIWYGATWAAVANKRAIINFWFDGTYYHASGINQV